MIATQLCVAGIIAGTAVGSMMLHQSIGLLLGGGSMVARTAADPIGLNNPRFHLILTFPKRFMWDALVRFACQLAIPKHPEFEP